MKDVPRDIQERAIKNFYKCDPEYGDGISKVLGFPSVKSKLWSDRKSINHIKYLIIRWIMIIIYSLLMRYHQYERQLKLDIKFIIYYWY